MGEPHAGSCGRRLAQEIKRGGGNQQDAAIAINQHCDVSLLRAHRIAHGYTLTEVVDLLKDILREHGAPREGLAHQTVSRWENRMDSPSEHYLDALCYLYRTRPDQLGFGHDYSTDETSTYEQVYGIPSIPGGTPDFSRTSVRLDGRAARRAVELLEQRAEQSGYDLYTTLPADYIPARMVDLANIQALLLQPQSADVERRLNRAAAKNAGFIGIRLTDVASAQETFNWFSIARQAARRAQDAGIEAWIAGHLCDGHACYHFSLRQGLHAARVAQQVNEGRPNSAAVFGYLAEAGVQARLGHRRETLHAVTQAERIFNALPSDMIEADGIRIPEYFLRWHQSNALSIIGEGRLAAPLRNRALEFPLGQGDVIGRALLHLDEASLLFRGNEADEGALLIKKVWHEVPAEFHAGQVAYRTDTILHELKSTPAVAKHTRELADYLRQFKGA